MSQAQAEAEQVLLGGKEQEAQLAQEQTKGNIENKRKKIQANPYVSVMEAIKTKAKADLGLGDEDLRCHLSKILRNLIAHSDDEHMVLLTDYDMFWLTELIYWEFIFPDEKEAFPGVRPERPAEVRRFAPGYVPACVSCAKLGFPDDHCPFVRFLPCPSGIHLKYKQRVGYEWDGCPVCWQEHFEAAKVTEEQAEAAELEQQHSKRQRLS